MSISNLGLIAASGNVVKDWELKYAHFDGITPGYVGLIADSVPTDLQFNSDGTRVYVIGSSRDTIVEYALSKPYDVGTIDIIKFVIGSEISNPSSIEISSDGTKILVGNNTSTLYYYTLSRAFDITSATYTGSASFSAKLSSIKIARLNNNNTLLHILDNNSTLYQYSLSSPGNITTASFVKSFNYGTSYGPLNSFYWVDSKNITFMTTSYYFTDSIPYSTDWDILSLSHTFNSEVLGSFNDGCKRDSFLTGIPSANTTSLQDGSASSISLSTFGISGNMLSITSQDGNLMFLLANSGGINYITTFRGQSTSSSIANGSQGFYIGATQSAGNSLYYKQDNTGLYICGATPARVHAINFTTTNSFNTAVIDTVNTILSPSTLPSGIFFKPDGTRLYLTDDGSNICYEYSLSTAWNIATATRTTKDYNFTTVLGLSPRKCIFSPDGLKVFVSTFTNFNIYQYSLGTAWDLTTLNTGSAVTFTQPRHASSATTTSGIAFDSTGKKFFRVDSTSDYLYGYVLQNSWDLSSPTENYKFSTILEETNSSGIAFNSSGTKMYVLGNTGDDINNYNLSTPWRVETAVYNGVYVVSTQTGTTPITLIPNSTATKMFVLSGTNKAIYLYTTSSAGSFVTGLVSYYSSLSVNTEDTNPQGIAISHDDTKLYMLGATNRSVYEYTLGSGGILVGASYSGNSVNLSSFITTPRDLFLGKNGTRLYITDISTKRLYQFNMSTAYSLSTATYVGYYDLPAIVNTTAGLFFKPDGKAFFTVDSTSDHVFKYLIG